MSDSSKKYLVGVYDDDDVALKAVKTVRDAGVKVHEVYSPFAIHGMDDAIGHKRTRIGIAAFMFGVTGFLCACTLTIWTMGIDWPMIIGGKDPISLPNYVPAMFELTVLFTAFGMTISFFITNGLGPSVKPVLFDSRCTDNKFVMAIDLSKNKIAEADLIGLLKSSGAEEVSIKQA
jgi:Protein of unknown function (DUF3341)